MTSLPMPSPGTTAIRLAGVWFTIENIADRYNQKIGAMYKTALYDKHAAAGARLGVYSGAETAASFKDVGSEFRELNSGCALYDLGWRAKLAITGEDRL